jgi:cell wall-associated NlpC family hydrolase
MNEGRNPRPPEGPNMIKKILTLSVIAFTSIYAKPIKQDKLANTLHKLIQKEKGRKTQEDTVFRAGKASSLIKTAKGLLGVRYRWGGTTIKGLDCSGFTQKVFGKYNKHLPRTSRMQASVGRHIDKKNLRPGDLVFFSSAKTKKIAHVGIYIGHNKFIHASSGKHKVTITNLNKSYYRRHYKGSRRIL